MDPQQNNEQYQSNEPPQRAPQPGLAPEPPATPLPGAPQQPNLQSYPMPPKKGKGMMIGIIVAVILVVAGAVVAVLLLSKKHDNSKNSSEKTSQNTSANDVLEAQAYEIPSAHVSIRPPKGWKATPNPDPSEPSQLVQFTTTFTDTDGKDKVAAVANLTYGEEATNIKIDEIESLIAQGVKDKTSEDVQVDGVPARLLQFTATNDQGVEVQTMALVVVKGKRGWAAACAITPGRYDTYKDTCRQTLLSLKFLP